jgi:hypothetical protein
MTRQVLIDNIVRQTTILIAQLATLGGVRSPLARVADQVFLNLAHELDAQGISRKVSADMFGMALRSYRRRVRQLSESSTERGRTLWEAVLAFLAQGRLVTRDEVLKRFHRDEEALVKGVLNDLCETGLVFRTGVAKGAAYRAATAEELTELRGRPDGLLELVWMLVYRDGPIGEEDLQKRTSLDQPALGACLSQLVAAGRIERSDDGRYDAGSLVLPLGSSAGSEAALFDHYQAMVRTLCARLQATNDASQASRSGGSTYSFTVWPGHPCEDEVHGLLREYRERHSELRERIEAHNREHALPEQYERVTAYGGVCVLDEDRDDPEQGEDDDRA